MSTSLSLAITIIAVGSCLAAVLLGQERLNRASITFAGAAAGAIATIIADLDDFRGSLVALAVGGVLAVVQHQLPRPSGALAALAASATLVTVGTSEAADHRVVLPLVLGAVAVSQLHEWFVRTPIDLRSIGVAASPRPTDVFAPIQTTELAPGPTTVPSAQAATVTAEAAAPVAPLRPVEVTLATVGQFATVGANPRLLRSADKQLPHFTDFTTPAHTYDGYTHAGYSIRAASHIGTKHMAGAGPRQDAVSVSRTGDGRHIVAAVADGVGSATHSAIGSEWAARTATRLLVRRYDTQGEVADGRHVALIASQMIERVAATVLGEGTDPNLLSTTLVLTIVDTTSGKVLVYRVGDSGATLRLDSGWQHCFEDSADVGASTNAIPSDDPVVESWYGELQPGQCILLMTDGIGDLIQHSPDVASALHHLTEEPGTAGEFSSIVGFQRQQAHDDQSAIGIWRDRLEA